MIKLSLCLINDQAMKVCGGSGGIAILFFISALDGGDRSASRRGRFTSRKEPSVPIE
jgi:hypothetical protein